VDGPLCGKRVWGTLSQASRLSLLRSKKSYFLRQTERQQTTGWTALGKLACEWRRWRLTGCHLQCLGDGGSRPGPQLLREVDLDSSSRTNIKDISIGNKRLARLSFFVAKTLLWLLARCQ